MLICGVAAALPARAGLISYWNFNDGATVTDQVGTNNGIAFKNYGTFPTHSTNVPPGGGAYSLDLTHGKDYVTLPPATNGIDKEFTMSMWVNWSVQGRSIFSIKRDLTSGGGDRTGIGLGIQNGKAYLGIISSGDNDAANTAVFHDINTATSVPSNVWVHLAATVQNDKATIYINGVAETTYTGAGKADGTLKILGKGFDFTDPVGSGSFTGFGADGSAGNGGAQAADSGGDWTSLFFDGYIDEVAIWNVALSATDIQFLASGGSPPSALTLVLKDILPANNSNFLPASTPITFTAQSTDGIDDSGIKLLLNGVDRSSDLVITGDPLEPRMGSFNKLSSNLVYTAQISITDRLGKTRSQTITFNTFSVGTFSIEAEDYDFGGGQYINNPQLASSPGSNNYLDRQAVEIVDDHVIRVNNANPYRIGDKAGTGFANDNPLRQAFKDAQATDPGVDDYALNVMQNGEWYNYSRDLPAGSYQVFARVGATAAYNLQLGAVSGSSSNQQVLAVGSFTGGSTGAAETYALAPLKDTQGNPLILSFNGKQTLRVTAVAAPARFNYLFFVPSTATNLAAVTVMEPANGSIGVATNAPVNAVIVNQSTKVAPSSVHLAVNGTDVTALAQKVTTPLGMSLSYAPAEGWPEATLENVSLTFSDDAPTPNVTTRQWSFTVRRIPVGNTPQIFQDAIFRVTFAGDSVNDVTTGSVSQGTATDVTFTSDVPPMANRTGRAAVFNGTTSVITYGLGADNELAIRSNLTYHARVRYNAAAFAAGRPEQWLFGRFRASSTATDTRVSILSTQPAPVGTASLAPFGGVSADGNAWAVGLPAQSNVQPGTFYDVFLRFQPGVAVWFDVLNAETGTRVGASQMLPTTVTVLRDATSPLDVGNRTVSGANTVPLAGDIEQMNIWARTLSDAEIYAINNGALPAAVITLQQLRLAAANRLELTFGVPGVNGGTYRLDSATTVVNPQWAPVNEATFTVGGDGSITAAFPPPASSPQFYRIAKTN